VIFTYEKPFKSTSRCYGLPLKGIVVPWNCLPVLSHFNEMSPTLNFCENYTYQATYPLLNEFFFITT